MTGSLRRCASLAAALTPIRRGIAPLSPPPASGRPPARALPVPSNLQRERLSRASGRDT